MRLLPIPVLSCSFLISTAAYAAPIRVAVEGVTGSGAVATAAQLNDDTHFDFTATVVTAGSIDTAAELASYDVVILGDSGSSDKDWTAAMASALVTFVNNGGGVVSSGWADYAITSTTTGGADLDTVMPIDAYPDSSNYHCYGSPSLTPTTAGASHPIFTGITSVSTSSNNIEISPLTPDDLVYTIVGTASGSGCTSTTRYAAVVGDYGSGRTVYLGLLYMANSGAGTGTLRAQPFGTAISRRRRPTPRRP